MGPHHLTSGLDDSGEVFQPVTSAKTGTFGSIGEFPSRDEPIKENKDADDKFGVTTSPSGAVKDCRGAAATTDPNAGGSSTPSVVGLSRRLPHRLPLLVRLSERTRCVLYDLSWRGFIMF